MPALAATGTPSALRALLVVTLLPFALLACAPSASDAGVPDDGGTVPAGNDAGDDDAGAALDAGPSDDAGVVPLPGFGALSGVCDVLDDELTQSAPSFFANAIDFGSDPYDDEDYAQLSSGGQTLVDTPNAGGSSVMSEVFAYEILRRCEGAELLKTETQIEYLDEQGKITDLLVRIDGLVIGVSVTRAVAFPFEDPYSVEQAQAILEQKLSGVLASSANVAPVDAWQKQILSVIAYSAEHGAALEQAFALIDDAIRADTIVYVTVSNGDDAFLY